jgi:hypothetical protein
MTDKIDGKGWFQRFVYDPTGSSGPNVASGGSSSPPISTPSFAGTNFPNLSLTGQISPQTGPISSEASAGVASVSDEEVLRKALDRGTNRGFGEFLGAYMDLVGEGIESVKAAKSAIKVLGRQGISYQEISLAFLERIKILTEERNEFNQFIDEQAGKEVTETTAQLDADRQTRSAKLAEIERIQAEVKNLDQSIAVSEQSLSLVVSKKQKRLADFQATYDNVYGNINKIKQILDQQGGAQ